MALFVNIQVRDINKKILEKNEIEVLSMTKMKPLKKHESLKIELNKYREIVQEAKAEFMFLQRLDYTAGLVKVENPIKTANVKRAAREREGGTDGARGWSTQLNGAPISELKHGFFSGQNLNLLEIASCRSTVLRVSYYAEFQFESHTLFEAKLHKVRFPIEFYGKPFDPEMPDFLLTGKPVFPQKRDYPNAFDPQEMPTSHFDSNSQKYAFIQDFNYQYDTISQHE